MAILDIDEAANYLKMSRRSLENLVKGHKLPATKMGGKWIFSEDQLLQAIEYKCLLNNMSEEIAQQQTRPPNTRRARNAIP